MSAKTTGELNSAIHDLGQAAFNMPYADFLVALGLEDDNYARDKYTDLKRLAQALAPFSSGTLVRITQAYTSN
jgi:hypothetical protein